MQLTSTFAIVLIAVVLCVCEAQWGGNQWDRTRGRGRSGSWGSLDRRQGGSWNRRPGTFDRRGRQGNFVGGIGGLQQGGRWCDDQCDAEYHCESSQGDGGLQCHNDLTGDIYRLGERNTIQQGGRWCDDQCDAEYHCESSQGDGGLQCHNDLTGDIYRLGERNTIQQGGRWCDDQCDAEYHCESSQLDGGLQCHNDLTGDIYRLGNFNRRSPLPLGTLGLGGSTWKQAACCLLTCPARGIPTPGCPSNTINNNYWTFNQGSCQRTSILDRFVQYIGSDADFGNFYNSRDLCSRTCIGDSLSYGGQAGYAERNNFQGGLAEPSNFGRQIAFTGQGFDGRVRRYD